MDNLEKTLSQGEMFHPHTQNPLVPLLMPPIQINCLLWDQHYVCKEVCVSIERQKWNNSRINLLFQSTYSSEVDSSAFPLLLVAV